MSPSPEHVKSLAGRIFTTVLAFSLGILLAFSAVMVSIFYYSYEHDAEQAWSRRPAGLRHPLTRLRRPM